MHRPTVPESRPELLSASVLRRPNFFEGKLLTAEDFRREQDYHRDRQRLTVRTLYGTGVVSGLRVSTARGVVTVSPGVAIDCLGELLVIATAVTIPHPADDNTIFVAIRGVERGISPIPSVGGSSSHHAEFSETEESSEVQLAGADCARRHRHEGKRMVACGEPHPVPLARLRRSGRGWSLDRKWKPQRVRA